MEHLTIQLLWATVQLLVILFSFIYPVVELPFKEKKACGRFKSLSYCFVLGVSKE